MSNVHSYITVKLYQIRIILSTILTHRNYVHRRVKLKTVTKLDNITGRPWWITLYIGTLIHQNSK